MANEFKIANALVLLNGNPITLASAAADPGSPVNGQMYYNSTSNKVRSYEGGAWGDTSGTTVLTGAALNDGQIIIGNGSNLSAAVTPSGDITISNAGVTAIGSGVIVNADINASAAIAFTKMAALTANRALASSGGGVVTDALTTAAELDFVSGVTSAIQTQLNNKVSTSLASGNIIVGSAGGVATAVAMSGEASIVDTGAVTLSNAAVIGKLLTGYVSGAGTVAATDSILQAIQKLNGNDSNAANRALSNLASVAINTTLVSDTDVTDDLGTSAIRWNNIFAAAIKDASSNTVLDITNRILKDQSAVNSIDFTTTRELYDGAGSIVAAYGSRQLRSGGTVKLDWSATDLNVATRKIINLSDPTSAQDAATKVYVDNLAQGLKPKQAVRAATTVAGTLATSFEATDVIDGVTLATGNRILIKNQVTTSENGIYIVNVSGAPTRATDFDSISPIDEVNGAYVAAQEGTANQGAVFVQQGLVTTIGTDPIVFVQFTSAIGANVSLSNLSATAINVALRPGADGTIDLGTGSLRFNNIYGRYLLDASSNTVMDIASRRLESAGNILSVDIANRTLNDAAAASAVDYANRLLEDASGNNKVVWSGNDIALQLATLKRSGAANSNSFLEEQYFDAITLTASTTAVISSLTYALASFEGCIIEYKMKEATTNEVRTGRFRVANNGTVANNNDDYVETASLGVSLTAAINGANVEISYTNDTNAVTMRADVKRIRT